MNFFIIPVLPLSFFTIILHLLRILTLQGPFTSASLPRQGPLPTILVSPLIVPRHSHRPSHRLPPFSSPLPSLPPSPAGFIASCHVRCPSHHLLSPPSIPVTREDPSSRCRSCSRRRESSVKKLKMVAGGGRESSVEKG